MGRAVQNEPLEPEVGGMQVYISHAALDREIAGRLSAELARAGFKVWNADDVILPGDNWALEMGKALESSDVMVVLFSRHASQWPTLRQDVQYAVTSGKYPPDRVVPVLLDFATFDVGKDVPWVLLRLDPVYLESSSPDFTKVVTRVQAAAASASHASA
jgi:hypothetical protein